MGTATRINTGSPGAGSTASIPYATGVASGVYALIWAVWVTSINAGSGLATPSGWTKLAEGFGGSASAGNNVGGRYATTFGRELDGSESGSVALDFAGTPANNVIIGRMNTYSKDSGIWVVESVLGQDATSGTGVDAVAGSALEIAAGDEYQICLGYAPRANTLSSQAVDWGSATLDSPNVDGNTANTAGYDVRQVGYRGSCTAGSDSVAPSVSATASAAIDGAVAIFTRIRAYDAPSMDDPAYGVWDGSAIQPATKKIWTGSALVDVVGSIQS